MPVCRNEVGMQRPSTGDQGNRKRERVFLKVRPSTGEWKNPKKPLEGSGRLQVAFADRPFVLDGELFMIYVCTFLQSQLAMA